MTDTLYLFPRIFKFIGNFVWLDISNTNENGNTIYEERSAINSSATRKKALTMLDYLFDEVIGDINALVGTTRKASELPEVSHG